jgi:hypothetical protein
MGNLKKRELIILGVMGIALLFGAYTFFAASGTKQKKTNPAALADDMAALLGNLNAGKSTAGGPSDAIFAMAQKEWARDPFRESSAYKKRIRPKRRAIEKPEAGKKTEFVYTGYLEVGGKRMAIVNDIERHEGEPLEIRGHLLKSADDRKIIILNTATGVEQSVVLQDDYPVKQIDGTGKPPKNSAEKTR